MSTITEARDTPAELGNVEDATQVVQDVPPKYPGFEFLGIRVSYIKTDGPMGWGHDEGDIVASNLFSIAKLYEKIPTGAPGLQGPPSANGLRVVAGKHSVWFLR